MRALAILVAVPACVLQPTDDGSVAGRLVPIAFGGYAAASGAPLQIRAWDYGRSTWEPLADFRATGTAAGEDVTMYLWQAAPYVGKRYWGAPDAPCSTPGTARFEVREQNGSSWYSLGTFDAAAMDCLDDHLLAGDDDYAAGAACSTGHTVEVRAPGTCVTAPAVDTTSPALVVHVTDGEHAWQLWPGILTATPIPVQHGRVHLDADAFDAQGPASLELWFDVDVLCTNGTFSLAPSALNVVHAEQAVTPNAVVNGTLGKSFDVDIAYARNLCGAGYVPVSATVWVSALARNASGLVASTPEQGFALTF